MPTLTVSGQTFNGVMDARVKITHGDAAVGMPVPICQIFVSLRLDRDTTLARWALAPPGPDRWKKVELRTLDQDMVVRHIWTLHRAYVHNYREIEDSQADSGTTDSGSRIEIELRGLLPDRNVSYVGDNILRVTSG